MNEQRSVNDTRSYWFRLRLADRPYLLLTMTALLWSTNLILGRYIAGHVPPIAISCIRWGVASLLILPLAWPHLRRDWPAIRADLPLLAVLGVTGYTANSILSYYGLQYTTALNALLMQSVGPLFVALWALLLFRIVMTPAQMIGISISMLGVLVIIMHGDLTGLASINFNKGDLMVIGALLTFGLYSSLVTRRRPMHPFSFLVVVAAIAAVLMSPLAAAEAAAGFHIKFDLQTVAATLYAAVFPSALAIMFFNRGVELIGPNRAAPFFHLTPAFGSVLAIVFLGEQPMLYHFIGYVLVLAGVFIAARK
jgi:drug/metabolite transporter (DMT)-like permease